MDAIEVELDDDDDDAFGDIEDEFGEEDLRPDAEGIDPAAPLADLDAGVSAGLEVDPDIAGETDDAFAALMMAGCRCP